MAKIDTTSHLPALPKPGSGTSDTDDSRSGSTVLYIASMSAGSNRIRRDGVTTCRTRPALAHRRRVSGETPTSSAASPDVSSFGTFCTFIVKLCNAQAVQSSATCAAFAHFCSYWLSYVHDPDVDEPRRHERRRSARNDVESIPVFGRVIRKLIRSKAWAVSLQCEPEASRSSGLVASGNPKCRQLLWHRTRRPHAHPRRNGRMDPRTLQTCRAPRCRHVGAPSRA